jgi:hypothetical protein
MAATFDKKSGTFSSLKLNGVEFLERGARINLWRALTDNDKGGFAGDSFAQHWQAAGLDELVFDVETVDVSEKDGAVRIDVAGALLSASADISVKTSYVVHGNGEILVTHELDVPESVQTLPRVGAEWLLKKEFDRVTWYGRGPHENYIDRKEGARFGIYESSVEDLYFPYVKPQENGNRSDVYWMTITNSDNVGLRVEGHPAFEFSATFYSLENLTGAEHTTDIEDAPYTTLNIDYGQAGLGGDSSWQPRTHPEYQLSSGKYGYSYTIVPVALSD